MNSKNIPVQLIEAINYNIGMFQYFNKEYEESFHYFIENAEKFKSIKERIFIGAICTKLNKELPDIFLNNDYNDSSYKLYIDYFKLKKNGESDKDLIEFINNALYYQKLIDQVYYEPLWHIFENEMDYFLKKSRKHYDSYIEFKEKMDKTCKYR